MQKLVRYEIDQNLRMLDAFWKGIEVMPPRVAEADPGPDNDELDFIRRRRLAETPLPPLSRLMWESQAGLLADAITDTGALTRAFELHLRLSQFSIARTSLGAALHGDGVTLVKDFDAWTESRTNAAYTGQIWTLESKNASLCRQVRDFKKQTFSLYAECEGIVNALRTQGNPLA